MSEHQPVRITDAQFEEKVLKGRGLALVDFWAPWCGPCVGMAPALEAFTKRNGENIHVFKLDVDDNPKTAEKYQIQSVPTLIFFKDGEPVDVTTGALSEPGLQEKLDHWIKQ
jgi:thioredoxin 1